MANSGTIDVNASRDFDMRINGLTGLDDVFTFYYDETNNTRTLYIGADGFNVPKVKCFVLGGVAHSGAKRDLHFEELRQALRLQPTVKELKLEHVAKGDFLAVIDKPKMTTFLQWLSENGLLVHYFALDPLYWALVDIVDSILADAPWLYPAHFQLKSHLYSLLRQDMDATLDFLRRYDFPDVGRARRTQFMHELLDWLEACEDMFPHFEYQMLKGVLQMGAKMDALPFLEDEKPKVLVGQFSTFYIKRFSMFKNAQHIADMEPHIRDLIEPLTFLDEGRPIRNFSFVTSHDEVGVQVSDVVVSVLGKLFSYLNETPREELQALIESLTPVQRHNLGLLNGLLDRSLAENEAMAHFVVSAEDRYRASILLGD